MCVDMHVCECIIYIYVCVYICVYVYLYMNIYIYLLLVLLFWRILKCKGSKWRDKEVIQDR